MRRLALALAVAALLAPATASADTITVRPARNAIKMTHTTTALITDAARREFGGERCAGRITWIFNARPADLAYLEADGVAFVADCRIAVAPLEDFWYVCDTATHELGHLGGRLDVADESDVMSGPWRTSWTVGCVRAERIFDRGARATTRGQKSGTEETR